MTSPQRQNEHFDAKIDIALRTKVQSEKGIAAWLCEQMPVHALRAGKLALPSEPREWMLHEGTLSKQLPSGQMILNSARQKNPGQSDERLLRRTFWKVIAGLDPSVDTSFVRRHVDVNIPNIRLAPSGAQPINDEGIESTEFTIQQRYGNMAVPVGKVMMRFKESPVRREAWLDTFTPRPVIQDVDTLLLATHVAAAEEAHGELYTFRTPPDKAMSAIYKETWAVLVETTDDSGASIARVERPIEPLQKNPNAYFGRVALAPSTPYVLLESGEITRRKLT